MELTPAQQRTLEHLIGFGSTPDLASDLHERVRRSLEARLAAGGVRPGSAETIWLGKHRLNDRQRCEGLFQAGLLREGPAFEHSHVTASGRLFHKAIELDVATERAFDPFSVCERAAGRVAEQDGSFGKHWAALDHFDQADLLADASRHLALFRDSFPPLQRRWAPQSELLDRKSTRLNSSHVRISYAVFCLKKKKKRIKRINYEHTQNKRNIQE